MKISAWALFQGHSEERISTSFLETQPGGCQLDDDAGHREVEAPRQKGGHEGGAAICSRTWGLLLQQVTHSRASGRTTGAVTEGGSQTALWEGQRVSTFNLEATERLESLRTRRGTGGCCFTSGTELQCGRGFAEVPGWRQEDQASARAPSW